MIVQVEDIDTLLKKQMKMVKVVFKSPPPLDLDLPEAAQKESLLNKKLSFEYLGSMTTLVKWLSMQEVYDVTMTEPDLESLFMNYYER